MRIGLAALAIASAAACAHTRSAPPSPQSAAMEAPASEPGDVSGPIVQFAKPFNGFVQVRRQIKNQPTQILFLPLREGRAEIPDGRCAPAYYRLERGADRVLWDAEGRFDAGETANLRPGQTLQTKAGPPFRAQVTVRKDSSAFDLALIDAAGQPVAFYRESHGNRERASDPGFEILDATGKQVFAGRFKYG